MNKIYTDIEQSQKLIELGIDPKSADMYYPNMIAEDYCSKEIYRLLRERGFDGEIHTTFDKDGYTQPSITLQMACKWLREEYNIYISIQPDFPSDKDYKMCWCWSANILHENCISLKGYQCYIETYEEATEAALKYCLEKLI